MSTPIAFRLTVAALPEVDRLLHRVLLADLAATGRAPEPTLLATTVGLRPVESRVGLRRLEAAGYVVFDATGRLAGVYPFSAVPAAHAVSFGGDLRHVPCALDALGITALLGRGIGVESTCAVCRGPIRLRLGPGAVTDAEPAGAAVVAGLRQDDRAPADSPAMAFDFACCPSDADALAARRVSGEVLPLARAHAIGEETIAELLGDVLPGRGRFGAVGIPHGLAASGRWPRAS